MTSSRTRSTQSMRFGLTLVEIMIALTMTLIVLGAMMTAFQYASQKMQLGRAVMEMANRLRAAEELLRSDLSNLTLDPRPYTESTIPNGYFEIVEGPSRDKDTAGQFNNYVGDVDDFLGMTVRSSGTLFRGRSTETANNVIESSLAEIVWFTTLNDLNNDSIVDLNDSVRVHRRVLLIRPDLGTLVSGLNFAQVNQFLGENDISCRVVSTNAADTSFDLVANNLADLSVRKNRFCHIPDTFNSGHNFPNVLNRSWMEARRQRDSNGDFNGNDIMLTDVASFDVRVFSPDANVGIDSDVVVEPGDIGFVNVTSFAPFGAYVDLDHLGGGWFSALQNPTTDVFYDTWTPIYESDGLDQDRNNLVDQGTNGLDNGGPAAPDDDTERETRPPYPFPVRGVKATIRLIEKNTKQVHQSSVIHSYVPE